MNKFLDGLTERGLINQSSGVISLPTHHVQLTQDVKGKIENVEKQFQSDPYSPPSLSELKQSFGEDLINVMIANKLLIVTSDDIAFRIDDFNKMALALVEFIQKEGGITLAQFRDMFKTSRKFALSFLEYLDKRNVTKFDGKKRVLRDIDKLNL